MGRRSNPKHSEEEQWFVIWDLVFPGRERPRSAYRDCGTAEALESFREFCAINSEDVLDRATQAVMATGEWPGFGRLDGEERRSIMRWMGRDGFEISFMQWHEERVAAGTAGEEGGSVSSNGGETMLAQGFTTPVGYCSPPDSGVVVAGEARGPSEAECLVLEEDVLECGRGGAVEEEEAGSPPATNLQGTMLPDDGPVLVDLFGSRFDSWDFEAGLDPMADGWE